MSPLSRRVFATSLAAVFATLLGALLAASPATQAQTSYRWTDKDGQVNYSDLPPPADARDVQQKKLGPANLVDTSGPSYSAQKAAQDAPVALYTSVDCAAECQLARDFLKRRGISYGEKVVKSLDDARAFKKAAGADELVVPTLLVGTVANKGFEENSWNKLLDAAGYPPAGRRDPTRP